MTNVKVDRRTVYSQEEIDMMLQKASEIDNEYYALRSQALVSLFMTGKRRGEVGTLEGRDLREERGFVFITFRLEKKRTKTQVLVTKKFPIASRYGQHILKYRQYLKEHYPKAKYFFPSVRNVFGMTLAVSETEHLSGRQILNIIKDLNPEGWCHLFRETRGAEIVKADEEKKQLSILTVYRVQGSLDLEKEDTAWHYIKRYATELIGAEEAETIA